MRDLWMWLHGFNDSYCEQWTDAQSPDDDFPISTMALCHGGVVVDFSSVQRGSNPVAATTL